MSYRYLVRSMRGSVNVETELAQLSADGWEPVNFNRDASGQYEVILRRLETNDHEEQVLRQLEETTDLEPPALT